jgi:sterol 3beta-glucosyltransferase
MVIRQVERPLPLLMLASGTQGDVQPYLALGTGLQNTGIPVVIASSPKYRTLIEGRGVGYAPLDGNPSDLMGNGSGAMALSLRDGPLRGIASTVRFLRDAQDEYARMLDSASAACSGARAIVVGLPSTWGVSIAEALGVPCIFCMLQPWGRTRAFPSPLLPVRGSLGGLYNAATYRAVEQAMWLPWRGIINRWRRKALGLPACPPTGPWASLYSHGYACLYGFSPSLLSPPDDWPAAHKVTGYWFLDPEEGWAPNPELERFLSPTGSGERPLYIGFGSMGMEAADLNLIHEALRAADARAIVSAGGQLQGKLPSTDSTRLLVVGDVPHGWLFPRVSAVVHHGGAGTTAEGLRAGAPTLVIPGASDQYFWGECVARNGAGPRPLTRRRLTAGALAAAIRQLLRDGRLRDGARRIGERIRAEDGVATAVSALLQLLR